MDHDLSYYNFSTDFFQILNAKGNLRSCAEHGNKLARETLNGQHVRKLFGRISEKTQPGPKHGTFFEKHHVNNLQNAKCPPMMRRHNKAARNQGYYPNILMFTFEVSKGTG